MLHWFCPTNLTADGDQEDLELRVYLDGRLYKSYPLVANSGSNNGNPPLAPPITQAPKPPQQSQPQPPVAAPPPMQPPSQQPPAQAPGGLTPEERTLRDLE